MKVLTRLLVAATLTGALAVPATSAAEIAAPRTNCPATYTLKMFKRAADATYAGTRLPPRGAYGRLWRYVRCQRSPAREASARRAWGADLRAWAARRDPPAPATAPSGGGDGLGDVPGVPYSFASCVAFRESTNGQLSSNVYGMLSYHGESIAVQKQEFAQMYAARGTEPWAPYDGC